MSEYFIQIITVLLSHKTKRAHSTVHYIYIFLMMQFYNAEIECVYVFLWSSNNDIDFL